MNKQGKIAAQCCWGDSRMGKRADRTRMVGDLGMAGMNVNRSQESREDNQTYTDQGYGGIRPLSGPLVFLCPHEEGEFSTMLKQRAFVVQRLFKTLTS
jgi:hypothetical protein